MADTKLSALIELATTPATDDEVYIRDVSEAAADESKRITIANLLAAGVLTSRVSAYLDAADLEIADNTEVYIPFDTENFDGLGEFDSTRKTGTADATEASKLHDADGGFAAADVGRRVYNTTDKTKAVITGFVDSGELNLDADIMASGEAYIIGAGTFTVQASGYYLIAAQAYYNTDTDGKMFGIGIKNDGVVIGFAYKQSGLATAELAAPITGIYYLAIGEVIEIYAIQRQGSACTLVSSDWGTYIHIHRLS